MSNKRKAYLRATKHSTPMRGYLDRVGKDIATRIHAIAESQIKHMDGLDYKVYKVRVKCQGTMYALFNKISKIILVHDYADPTAIITCDYKHQLRDEVSKFAYRNLNYNNIQEVLLDGDALETEYYFDHDFVYYTIETAKSPKKIQFKVPLTLVTREESIELLDEKRPRICNYELEYAMHDQLSLGHFIAGLCPSKGFSVCPEEYWEKQGSLL